VLLVSCCCTPRLKWWLRPIFIEVGVPPMVGAAEVVRGFPLKKSAIVRRWVRSLMPVSSSRNGTMLLFTRPSVFSCSKKVP
jgi:hypothetical protein